MQKIHLADIIQPLRHQFPAFQQPSLCCIASVCISHKSQFKILCQKMGKNQTNITTFFFEHQPSVSLKIQSLVRMMPYQQHPYHHNKHRMNLKLMLIVLVMILQISQIIQTFNAVKLIRNDRIEPAGRYFQESLKEESCCLVWIDKICTVLLDP